jgi:hypothetical protein
MATQSALSASSSSRWPNVAPIAHWESFRTKPSTGSIFRIRIDLMKACNGNRLTKLPESRGCQQLLLYPYLNVQLVGYWRTGAVCVWIRTRFDELRGWARRVVVLNQCLTVTDAVRVRVGVCPNCPDITRRDGCHSSKLAKRKLSGLGLETTLQLAPSQCSISVRVRPPLVRS